MEEDISYVRVNRDELRTMRGKYWIPGQEDLITVWEQDCIRAALEQGYNVVSDSTNLNLRTVAALIAIGIDCDAVVEFKQIEVELDEAIRRDSLRPNPVGADVITNFYNRYAASKSSAEPASGI